MYVPSGAWEFRGRTEHSQLGMLGRCKKGRPVMGSEKRRVIPGKGSSLKSVWKRVRYVVLVEPGGERWVERGRKMGSTCQECGFQGDSGERDGYSCKAH